MRFDRESWRKLYVGESVEHRLMPLLARGLRDYLIRHAKDDGTILAKTDDPGGDLARALGAHADEFELIQRYVAAWIEDGYLRHIGGKLFIRKFREAQLSQSPGAKRQRAYRQRNQEVKPVTRDVTDNNGVTHALHNGNVTPRARARGSDETRNDETRREPPTPVTSDPDRETVCPLNLSLPQDVANELATWSGFDVSVIREAEREFLSYWTIGQGSGKRRSAWMGKLREDIRRKHHRGELGDIASRMSVNGSPEPKRRMVADVLAEEGL